MRLSRWSHRPFPTCGWLSRSGPPNAVTYEPTTAVIPGDEAAPARQEAGK
jgi:hypothetical protein